jgi:hypothetical protein
MIIVKLVSCFIFMDWWCELCGDELLWDAILLYRFGLISFKLIRAYSPFGIIHIA